MSACGSLDRHESFRAGGVTLDSKLRFSERVIPEISNITIADHPSFRWQDDYDGFEMTIGITIDAESNDRIHRR